MGKQEACKSGKRSRLPDSYLEQKEPGMKEAMFYSVAITAAGIFSLVMAIRFIVDKNFGERYIRESPKAFIWRKMFGEEKAYKMTKTIFAPLGIVISTGMIAMGAYYLVRILIR